MIRIVQQRDAEAIKSICRSELGHITTVSLLRQRIKELSRNDHYYIRVFEDENTHQVLGFIQAEKYNLLYGENGWNIIALAVEEKAQGRGIGTQLLLSLETFAKEWGDTFVRLNSNMARTEAHAFYQHLGYHCDKTQKRFIKNMAAQHDL